MFFEIRSIKNFAIFTGKHLFWGLFLIKLQASRPATFLKRDSNTSVSCEYCELCSFMQWTLSISSALYLKLLSIPNKKLGPLDICVLSKLFLSLYLELLCLEFFSSSNKNLGPLRLFLSLSRTFSRLRVHLHSK